MIYSLLSTRSSKWKTVRNNHLNKQTHCQACGTHKNLQVHHIIPVSIDKTKELDYNNLITLCKTCHFVFGHFMDWNSWNIDVITDCEVYLNKVKNRPYQIKVQSNENSIIYNCFNRIIKLLWRD